MEPITIPKIVRSASDNMLDTPMRSAYTGGVGQMQRLEMQGNPVIPCATSVLESKSAATRGHGALALNKLMREAKVMSNFTYSIEPVPKRFVWVTMADAACANRPDGASTSGHLAFAAHPSILMGQVSLVSVVAWDSRKTHRAVRSILGADCAALPTGLEHADLLSGSYGASLLVTSQS